MFVKELRNAAKFTHENIVTIEGFYFIEEKKPVIVSAWAGGGTMNAYMEENPKSNIREIVGNEQHMHI